MESVRVCRGMAIAATGFERPKLGQVPRQHTPQEQSRDRPGNWKRSRQIKPPRLGQDSLFGCPHLGVTHNLNHAAALGQTAGGDGGGVAHTANRGARHELQEIIQGH